MGDPDSEEHNVGPDWAERLLKLFSRTPTDQDTLRNMLRSASSHGIINSEALEMLEGVLNVSEHQVRDIMVPKPQMTALCKGSLIQDVMPDVIASSHSRFPVYDEEKEHIIGVLHTKDLLKQIVSHNGLDVALSDELLRSPMVVPESKRLDSLLKEFKDNHNHLAIVVDEYGAVAGLVTIEDILEEIVGDIEDEFDAEEPDIEQLTPQNYTVKALTLIEDFNTFFESNFSDEHVDTMGGLLMQHLGYVPQVKESLVLDHFEFTIEKGDDRHIELLLVRDLHHDQTP